MKKQSKVNRKEGTPRKRGRPAKPKPQIPFTDGLKDTKEVETIRVSDIDLVDKRFQYRVKEKVNDLIPSLIRDGQLVPVILWGNKAPYRVIDGHRRVAAIKTLEWESVKAIVRRNISEDDAYRLSFIENVKRKSFTPMDMAHAIWKAMERGKTTAELMHDFNFSERQIYRYKKLIAFAKPIREALTAGDITMAHAEVFNSLGIEEVAPWLEGIKSGMSAQALKRKIQKEVKPRRKPRKYLKKEKEGFRLYPMRFSSNMPTRDKQRVIRILKKALEIAESGE